MVPSGPMSSRLALSAAHTRLLLQTCGPGRRDPGRVCGTRQVTASGSPSPMGLRAIMTCLAASGGDDGTLAMTAVTAAGGGAISGGGASLEGGGGVSSATGCGDAAATCTFRRGNFRTVTGTSG